MYCSKCGKENRDNAAYCENCGASLKAGQVGDKSGGNSIKINWKAILGVGVIVALIILGVSLWKGGSSAVSDEKNIVGEWRTVESSSGDLSGETIEFYEDGTFLVSLIHGTYQMEDHKLTLKWEGLLTSYEKTFGYEMDGDRITLMNEDGELEEVWEKIE